MDTITKPIASAELLHRPKLTAKQVEGNLNQFKNSVYSYLQDELDKMEVENLSVSDERTHPQQAEELSRIHNLKLYEEQQKEIFLKKISVFEDIKLRLTTRIFSPAYELEWSENSIPTARFDGKMIIIGLDGFVASGIGISLSSREKVYATITPSGEYNYNWLSVRNAPLVRSKGGLGTLVYVQGNPSPLVHHNSTLWNIKSPLEWTGDTGQGFLSNLFIGEGSPPPMSFASYFVPITILMEPGVTYLFWIWTYQVSTKPNDSGFIAFLRCQVPAISVELSDPNFPIVH